MNRKRKYRYLILAFLALDLMLMEVQQIKERVAFHEKKRQSKMREYDICLILSGFLLLFSRALFAGNDFDTDGDRKNV